MYIHNPIRVLPEVFKKVCGKPEPILLLGDLDCKILIWNVNVTIRMVSY